MLISFYSVCMALIWFSVFVFLADRLCRKTGFLLHAHMGLLLCLIGFTVARLCLPLEFEFSQVISSSVLVPRLQDLLLMPLGSWTPLRLLLLIWLAGSLFFLLRLAAKLYQGKRALRQLSAGAVQSPAVLRCFAAVRGAKNCRVLIAPVRVPMMTGLLRPTILLPVMVTELPEQQLRHILQHEYGHVLGHDIALKLLLELLCCALWWNPLVYRMKQSLGQALEIKCDLRVTQTWDEGETLAYLQTILDVLRRMQRQKTATNKEAAIVALDYLGTSEALTLRQRLTVVSDYASTKKNSTALFLAVTLLFFAFSYSIVIQPAYPPPPATESGADTDYIEVTPENAHILSTAEEEYSLYVNGQFWFTIPENELSVAPYNQLKIIFESEKGEFS